jgi:hypothetical protein
MRKFLIILSLVLVLLPFVSAEPIGLSTCSELQGISMTSDYVLLNDIDCSDVSFAPLGGTWGGGYQGVFDGQGNKITNLNITSTGYVGVFRFLESSGVIKNVGVENIDVVGSNRVGGLVAYSYGYIDSVYITGAIRASDWNPVGGLVGEQSSGVINNSFSLASVQGNQFIGGLIGDHKGAVYNSFSAGQVTGSHDTGGFIGVSSGTGANNFWDVTRSGRATSAGPAVGKSSEDMKKQETFSAWDFESVWGIDEDESYPYLLIFDEIIFVGGDLVEVGSGYYIERLGNGAFRLVVGDAVTYYDGLSYVPEWRNIRQLNQYEFENYDFGVSTQKYDAYFKEEGGNVQLMSFVSNNTRVIYQPQVIGWINVWDGRENIAMPQVSNATIGDSRITYEDLYGEGIDLSYRAYGNYIRKEIHIENKSNLVPPSEFALSQGPVVFYAEYLLTISNVDRIVVDGVDWDFSSSVYTNNSIEIINTADDVLFKIKEPFVLDANNERFNATYQLFTESGSYRIRIIVPYETLWEDAVYPLIIDPTTGYDDENISILVLNLSSDEFSPLEKITLYNITGEGNLWVTNNLSDPREFSVSYAIDPEDLQFSYGEVQAKNAQGDLLLKCVDWDFQAQECGTCLEYENDTCITRNETWIHGADLIIGENYTFLFDNVDPAYGEYVLSTGESTTTSTTFVNKVSQTFTPMKSGYYVIMGTASITGSSTAHTVSARMTVDGVTIAQHNHEPTDVDRVREYPSFSGFTVQYLNRNQEYVINLDYHAGGGGTLAYIKEANIGAMLLEDNYYHYNTSVAQQTTSTTQSTYATLTFTAQYTGEYILLASGESYTGATNQAQTVFFYQGATLLDSSSYTSKNINDYMSFGYYKTVSLTQGQSYTYTIQSSITAGNGAIRNLHLVALPAMDPSLDYNFAESNAESTTNQNQATKVSFTFTPEYPGIYYLFASSQISHTSGGRGTITDVRINGVSVCNQAKRPNNAADWYPVNCLYAHNFTNTSHTVSMTFQSSQSGGSAQIRNARIGVFSVTDEYPDSCAYSGSGVWAFLENIYCHITQMLSQGDGVSNIVVASTNTTRFSVDVYGFQNLLIRNSSTVIIDNSSTMKIGGNI